MRTPLPTVEGVAPSRRRLPAGRWATVFEFLVESYPRVGADAWLSRMERGHVVDERGSRLDASSPYRAGACVYYYREPGREERIPFDESVVYEDEHILVADKPHFLPVVPSGRFSRETLLARLRARGARYERLAPVHRIDRETAGLVIFSLDPSTRGLYASLFEGRRVVKVYEAIAPGADSSLDFPLTRRSRIEAGEPFFRMREIGGEPNSETRVELIGAAGEGGGALYRLRPVTGKKHQLRLHMAALGIPILNDRLYPEITRAGAGDFSAPLKLLARSVSFRDPLTGRERGFESARKL